MKYLWILLIVLSLQAQVVISPANFTSSGGGGGDESALYTAATAIWDFENNANDTKSTYNLNNIGSATFNATSPPQGDYFARVGNGANTQCFSHDDNANLDIGDQDYTIAFWAYVDRDFYYCYEKETENAGDGGMTYTYNSAGALLVEHTNGYDDQTVTVAAGNSYDTWYHYIVTYHASVDSIRVWISSTSSFGDRIDGTNYYISQYPAASSDSVRIGRSSSQYGSTNSIDEMVLWIGTNINSTEAESIYDGTWR